MTTPLRRPLARQRRHGPPLAPVPRRELERAGWRTTLEYRENHQRALDGRLVRVEPVWTAEAECFGDEIVVATATGSTADAAWAALAERIARGAVERRRTVGVEVRQRTA